MRFRAWIRMDNEDEGEVVVTMTATDEHEIIKSLSREPVTLVRIEPA